MSDIGPSRADSDFEKKLEKLKKYVLEGTDLVRIFPFQNVVLASCQQATMTSRGRKMSKFGLSYQSVFEEL